MLPPLSKKLALSDRPRRHVLDPAAPDALWAEIALADAENRGKRLAVRHYIDNHVRRRPAGGLGEDVGDAMQVLVVDHLVDAALFPMTQLGQRHELAAASLDLDSLQFGGAAAEFDRHAQLDPQRVALGVALHQAGRASLQRRLQRAGDLLSGDAV